MDRKLEKILLVLVAAIMLVAFVKDWADFFACGVDGACLDASAGLQMYAKFAVSVLLTVFAFVLSRRAFSLRDAKILRAAFVCSLCADFCFSVLPLMATEYAEASLLSGIMCFVVYQLLMIFRHTRTSELDMRVPRSFGVVFVAALAIAGPYVARILDLLPAVILLYAVIVTASLAVAWRVTPGFFPRTGVALVRWGMLLFYLGDVCVGLAMLRGSGSAGVQFLAAVANNIVWLFYVPAQLMLACSCLKIERFALEKRAAGAESR